MGWLRIRLFALLVPAAITLAAGGLWLATGRDAYTKFTLVERIEVDAANQADDIFAQAGVLDENEPVYETVRREAFHFGLLPTPQGLFDKHMFSVASVVVPAWALGAMAFALAGARLRRQADGRGSEKAESPEASEEPDVPE